MSPPIGPSDDAAISAEGPRRVDELLVSTRDSGRQDGPLPLGGDKYGTVDLRHRSEFPRRDPAANLEFPPGRPKR